jgi:hypothetical protein
MATGSKFALFAGLLNGVAQLLSQSLSRSVSRSVIGAVPLSGRRRPGKLSLRACHRSALKFLHCTVLITTQRRNDRNDMVPMSPCTRPQSSG